jgi:hypothetical protein
MRESRTFGSVGGEGGNVLAYPAQQPPTHVRDHVPPRRTSPGGAVFGASDRTPPIHWPVE